jgi:hypothetical protein
MLPTLSSFDKPLLLQVRVSTERTYSCELAGMLPTLSSFHKPLLLQVDKPTSA